MLMHLDFEPEKFHRHFEENHETNIPECTCLLNVPLWYTACQLQMYYLVNEIQELDTNFTNRHQSKLYIPLDYPFHFKLCHTEVKSDACTLSYTPFLPNSNPPTLSKNIEPPHVFLAILFLYTAIVCMGKNP